MNKLSHKLFWTWDHSTNWQLNVPGNQSCGAGNVYSKKPETFLNDYRRSVDFCAEHGIDAIGIAGLLRDRHGGVEYARNVCAYAGERGVRIYLIAGLYAYGGIYHEGDHRYSLEKFLEENPDCMGKTVDGEDLYFKFQAHCGHKITRHGCPSNPKLNDFLLSSIEWLFKEIPELGGLQMETGDTGICLSEKCRERRGMEVKKGIDYLMSFEDMALIYPDAVRTVQNASKDAWAICETYHHFLPGDPGTLFAFSGATPSDKLRLLQKIPKEAFWQWVCDMQLSDGSWKENDSLPEELKPYRHIMRAHHGTYWRGGRHALAIDAIRRQCYLSASSGLQAVSMFGEGSPFHTNMEFNYLALEYFSDHPSATVEQFADEIMAPCLGGKSPAEDYLKFAVAGKDQPDLIPQFTGKILEYGSGVSSYEQSRRWIWLASYLNSLYWESRQKGFVKRDDKLVVL